MDLRLAAVDNRRHVGRIFELGVDFLHVVFECFAVGSACRYGHVDIFQVDGVFGEQEDFFYLLIFGFQLFVAHFYVLIGDCGIGKAGQLYFAPRIAVVKLHLGNDGVGEEAVLQEAADFAREQFGAQLFFGKEPHAVNAIDGFQLCGIHGGGLGGHLLVLLQEVLQGGYVEAAGLVAEELADDAKRLGRSFAQGVLHFGVGHLQAEFVGFVFEDFLLYVHVPHLVAELIHLGRVELAPVLELHDFGIFVHHVLVLLYGEFFAIYFADLHFSDVGGCFH